MILTSSEIKTQVLAIMWGDAFVDCNHNSGKARLDIYHKENQLDLLLYKKSVLDNITGIKTKVVEKNDNRLLKNGTTRKGFRLQTNYARYFYKLNQAPFKYVAKRLVNPKALSLLWASDGTLCISSKGYFSTAVLCTDSWDLWQIEEFKKQWNNYYGWCPTIATHTCKNKPYSRLRLIKAHAELLSNIIREHTLDCMKYKLLPCKTLSID